MAAGAAPPWYHAMQKKNAITPYHLAIRQGWGAVVQCFLKHGVPPNTPDKSADDASPFVICAYYSFNGPQIAELLLATGNINLIKVVREDWGGLERHYNYRQIYYGVISGSGRR